MTKELDAAPGDIRALKYRIHELEGEVIGYKRILDEQGKAKPVAVAHVGNMDHGPFEITPTAYGCDHLKHGDKLYTSPPDPGGLLRDALSNLNDLADQKNAEIDALKEAMRLALEKLNEIVSMEGTESDEWDGVERVIPEMCAVARAAIAALEGMVNRV